MPNTGKPSKDCHMCRKRRVKCTLERPECQRCVRIGKKCPGYRDQQSLMFRNEDISSLGSSSSMRDRRRTRSDNSSETEKSSGTTSRLNTPPRAAVPSDWSFRGIRLRDLDAIILHPDRSSQICPIPISEWSRYAAPLVLALISYEAEGQTVFPQLQILSELLMKLPGDSSVTMCCESIGIAYLANRFMSTEAETVRDQAYGQALAATTTLVGDPDLCQQDEASISVWLLSLYEVVAGPQRLTVGSSTITWSIHAQGQVELLRLRGPGQLKTWNGQNIFWLLAMSIQMRSLITGEEYPPFIHDWLMKLQESGSQVLVSGTSQAFFGLSSFAFDLSAIATRVQEALSTDDTQFLPWTIADLWDKLSSLRAKLDQALYDHPLGEPINLKNLYLSNTYRTYYTRTLHHMLDLAESAQARTNNSIPPDQLVSIVSSIKSIIQSLASATLSTIPTVLTAYRADQSTDINGLAGNTTCNQPACWADILKLLWPLRILYARKELLDPAQAVFAELVLQRINEEFGIRQAVATYDLLDSPSIG